MKYIVSFIFSLILCCCSFEQENKPFRYTPPSPVDGKLKGVIELGSFGFNSFVIYMDEDRNWDLKNAEYGINAVYENEGEKEIIESLKQYLKHLSDFGVSDENKYFVISSGAIKNEKVQKVASLIKKSGYNLSIVTPEEEGEYALKSILPYTFKKEAFVVDIGSGNTKITWIENDKMVSLESYGARYKQKKISDAEAFQDVIEKSKKVPQSKRKLCFIMGGIPYEMAKIDRERQQRYTVLKTVDAYYFDDERLRSGLNLYNGIRVATGCDRFVFDWDSNFSIGFLLSIKY